MNFSSKNKIKYVIRLLLTSVLVGVACGVTGAAFTKAIRFVTALRADHSWLVYLLPLGGLATVAIFRLFKTEGAGTKTVLSSTLGGNQVSPALLPSIFSGTVIGHLFGASVGREGAALQIGGAISSLISKLLHSDEESRRILTVCGMGATFSALFGAPLGACVFAVEVLRNLKFGLISLVPTLVSSFTAYGIALLMGESGENFEIHSVPAFDFSTLWRVVVISAATGIVGYIFCRSLNLSEHYATKLIKNPYIRILAGGIIVILLTVVIGNTDYNGGGIFVIERILESGTVIPYAFLLKILFTVISNSAGYKGGEIVPSFFIGATSGATVAGFIGLSVPFGAAVGMSAIFSAVTNCPIATLFICAEVMGIEALPFFIVSSIISAIVSGKTSLFHSSKE